MKLGRFVREEKWMGVMPKKQLLERQSVDDRYNFGGASGHRSFDFFSENSIRPRFAS
jgi:hypothetical protein